MPISLTHVLIESLPAVGIPPNTDYPPWLQEPRGASVVMRSPIYRVRYNKEKIMAFMKRSVGVTRPTPVEPNSMLSPEIGDTKDGKVWDGEKWVTEEEWKAQRVKER